MAETNGSVVGASEGDGDGFDRLGGVIGCAGVIDGDDVEGEGEGFALAKEVEVLSGGGIASRFDHRRSR